MTNPIQKLSHQFFYFIETYWFYFNYLPDN